jgi:putative ABC transport system substrate-binding protein
MPFNHLRRRDFITLLGGAAATCPLGARAQQVTRPVVGLLYTASPATVSHLTQAFRLGLHDMGFIEGQNVTIEYRFAEGHYERLPELIADLIGRKVAVIVAPGSSVVALAAKAATTTIPILFSVGDDPVRLGLVASLNRPGGNVTGVNFFSLEVGAKVLGLLRQLLPSAPHVGVLVNPMNPNLENWAREVTAAASAVGVQVDVAKASDGREIEGAFMTLMQNGAAALLIGPDPVFFSRRIQIATLATRHAVPSFYSLREHAESGGLMSYGASLPDVYRQLSIYTGHILKGAKPADLPVVQSTKFELVINLNTARALGLTIPADMLAIADEVIE